MADEFKVVGPIEDAKKAKIAMVKHGAVGWELIDMGNAQTGHLIYFKRDEAKGAALDAEFEFSEGELSMLNVIIDNFPKKLDGENLENLEELANLLDERGDKKEAKLVRRKANAIRVYHWPLE